MFFCLIQKCISSNITQDENVNHISSIEHHRFLDFFSPTAHQVVIFDFNNMSLFVKRKMHSNNSPVGLSSSAVPAAVDCNCRPDTTTVSAVSFEINGGWGDGGSGAAAVSPLVRSFLILFCLFGKWLWWVVSSGIKGMTRVSGPPLPSD